MKRFAILFSTLSLALMMVLAIGIYCIDPFNSGRSTLLSSDQIRQQGPRTAHAFRGRQPQFDGVIIGNSHVQLLSPERLTKGSSINFVSLTVPGTGPKEQLVMLDWFLRHRIRAPKTIVIGADGYWCSADPNMTNWKPFPFWLYSTSPIEYVRGLMSFNSLEEAIVRLQFILNPKNPARLDGYWDYEKDYTALHDAIGTGKAPNLDERKETITPNISGRYPALEALRDMLNRVPKTTGIFLVRPPVYITGLPIYGSAEAKTDANCLSEMMKLSAAHSQLTVLNWREERVELKDKTLFFDHTHYRTNLALAIEEQISALIKAFRFDR